MFKKMCNIAIYKGIFFYYVTSYSRVKSKPVVVFLKKCVMLGIETSIQTIDDEKFYRRVDEKVYNYIMCYRR